MSLSEKNRSRGEVYVSDMHKAISKEVESLGNTLWKGEPLAVVRHTLIKPQDAENVPFLISPKALPLGGDISQETLELLLRSHIRSRWAHVSLDTGREIFEQTIRGIEGKTIPTDGIEVKLRMVNHGSRPLLLQKDDKPFHFFVTPDAAKITGGELEALIGREDEDGIFPFGEEGKHWRKYYEERPNGDRILSGLYLKVDQEERYWIPDSDEPIIIPNFPTFNEVRDFLFDHYFKKSNDKDFPMPSNHLWIGRLLSLQIGKSMYAKLESDAFVDIGGVFLRKGLQTHSPLLEGRTDRHHVEVKGPADWVLVRFVRAGDEFKAG